MGCGATRMSMVDLYINEATPPFHLFLEHVSKMPTAFPPTGLIKKNSQVFFDDKEYVKQCQTVHIDEITVHFSQLITGFELKYRLDQSTLIRKHFLEPGKHHSTMVLDSKESIVRMNCRVSAKGVHSIELETNLGRELKVEGKEPGSELVKEDFRTEGRAVVAFKGCYGDTVKALGCYTWKIRTK